MARPSKYGDGYPSVTEIVGFVDKPGLRFWYGKNGWDYCEAFKKETADIGHIVHKAVDCFLKGGSFEASSQGLNDLQWKMFSRFVDWITEKKVKPVAIEESIISEKHQYGGTPDLICTMGKSKSLWVVDWKTRSSLHAKECRYQLAGYAIAYREKTGERIKMGAVKRVSRKLETDELIVDDLRKYEKKFLGLREAFRDWNGR